MGILSRNDKNILPVHPAKANAGISVSNPSSKQSRSQGDVFSKRKRRGEETGKRKGK
jgi:hypothetical protein